MCVSTNGPRRHSEANGAEKQTFVATCGVMAFYCLSVLERVCAQKTDIAL